MRAPKFVEKQKPARLPIADPSDVADRSASASSTPDPLEEVENGMGELALGFDSDEDPLTREGTRWTLLSQLLRFVSSQCFIRDPYFVQRSMRALASSQIR